MKDKQNYNWWEDPKNKQLIEKLSWWEMEENKTTIPFPVSIIKEGKYWVITNNSNTVELIGDKMGGVVQRETKEEAIKQFFTNIKIHNHFVTEKLFKYHRWVPFEKGPWGKIGGNWFSIFGFHFYFRIARRGKNKMVGGWFVPFTKLNILVKNYWKSYKKFKLKKIK